MAPTRDVLTLLVALSTVVAPVTARLPRPAVEPRLASAGSSENHDASRSLSTRSTTSRVNCRQEPGTITEGQCGEGFGACAAGYCCSEAGWCGQTAEYCTSPGCQLRYGPACQGNKPPIGNLASTASIPRPALGSVPYGEAGAIYSCTVPGTVALTYDDGPFDYTSDLLDILARHDAKATFFVNGNNGRRGEITDPSLGWGDVVKRIVNEGHQVASHTWSHVNSTEATPEIMQNQLVWNEMALAAVLPGGGFPTYYRPPYSICSAVCAEALDRLGYHVVYFDLDTADYLNNDPALIQNSKDLWDAALAGKNPATDSFLEIGHDIQYQTVYNLTEYMLTDLKAKGYRAVTVGECLGDPEENWYREV